MTIEIRWSSEQVKRHLDRILDPRRQRKAIESAVAKATGIMMDETAESALYKPIQDYCDARGWPWFHDRSKGKNRRGFLDFVIALPNGLTAWIECKRPKGGRLSPEQKQEILKLKSLKHHVFIIRTYAEFITAIEEVTK